MLYQDVYLFIFYINLESLFRVEIPYSQFQVSNTINFGVGYLPTIQIGFMKILINVYFSVFNQLLVFIRKC